jgi:2-oxoglutarate ferredoxin oxidoreductase subunit delta
MMPGLEGNEKEAHGKMPQGTVEIDRERCKECGLCVAFCPKQALDLDGSTMNASGYHPAILVVEENCFGCAICALMCPDVAITVLKTARMSGKKKKQGSFKG